MNQLFEQFQKMTSGLVDLGSLTVGRSMQMEEIPEGTTGILVSYTNRDIPVSISVLGGAGAGADGGSEIGNGKGADLVSYVRVLEMPVETANHIANLFETVFGGVILSPSARRSRGPGRPAANGETTKSLSKSEYEYDSDGFLLNADKSRFIDENGFYRQKINGKRGRPMKVAATPAAQLPLDGSDTGTKAAPKPRPRKAK